MDKILLTAVLVLAVSFRLESTASCPITEMAHPTEEEYAVFGTVMQELLHHQPDRKLFIQPRTLSFECGKESCNTFTLGDGCSAMRNADETSQDVLKDLRHTFPELHNATANDFEKKNTHCSLLENRFPVEQDYLWTGEDGKIAIGKRSVAETSEEWKNVDFVFFSRVGFDAEQKQALLYWALFCHKDCSWFGWYFLKKQTGKWEIDSNAQIGSLAGDAPAGGDSTPQH